MGRGDSFNIWKYEGTYLDFLSNFAGNILTRFVLMFSTYSESLTNLRSSCSTEKKKGKLSRRLVLKLGVGSNRVRPQRISDSYV